MAKPLMLRIESELDERSATESIRKAQRIYSDAARDMGRELTDKVGRGAREAGQEIDKMATDARQSYKKIGDATDELARQERVLAQMREEGARGVEVQAERVKAARKRERLAIKEAAAAYDEYEAAANRAGDAVENSMKGAATGVLASGKDAANNFASGFAGSSALMRLGAAGGPIGLALAGVATIGVLAGKALAGGIADGMATLQMQDVFQARMGLDEASMAQFGTAAGQAYANNWGASVADNLSAAQSALQSGIIDADATDAEIKTVIEQLQGMASVTEASTTEISRSISTMLRTGLAGSVSEASDIIVSGFQNGLDISGDWLDTINEYSTQFRKLGLDGGQVLTLLSQGMEGGARDTDKVADSLKEFAIRAVDGSKTTREGFQALGFDADDMGRRFAEGGESSKVALGAVLTALQDIEDPMQQGLIWTSLFGTQFEDMGDAINKFDMSSVGAEFTNLQGTSERTTKTATESFKSQWEAAQRSVEQGFNDLKTSLADWFTDLPLIRDLPGMVRQAADDIRGIPRQGAPGPIPGAVPGAPMNPLDMLVPGATPSASGPGGLLMPSLTGPPPPSGPVPDSPVPGARTPILTDAQAEAAKEAEKAAGGSGLPTAPSLPLSYTSTAGMPTAVANAQIRLDEVKHAQAEKEARLQQLLGSNVAKAEDIQKAKNDVAKAEQDSQQAQQALVDAQQKTFDKANSQLEKQTSALESFGAQLDADFGVSKGLAGIAENITKFVGNLLTAPLMNALGMVKSSSGFSGGQAGSGLMGMMGSSGAFGSRFMPMPDGYGQQGYGGVGGGGYRSGGGQPYGMPAGSNSGGYGGAGASFPGWVNQMAATFGIKPSTYDGHQESDRNEPGYAPNPNHENRGIDWTGPTENLQAFADYLKTIPGTLEQVIWQNPNTGQSTEIAGGSSQPGYFSGDLGGHRDHVHTRQSASLPIPGGGGASGAAAPGADWNAIAQAESSGNWGINSGNGYSGGLQFAPSTWNQYGGQQYAPEAWQATPDQQIAVGERTLAGQGPGAWPNTFVPASAGGGGSLLPGMGMPGSRFGGLPLGVGGLGGPGVGGAAGPSQSVMGGRSFGQGQPASGGISFNGGIIGAAVSQAAGAAGGMGSMGMGGGAASAASDMAMQLIGRAVGAAGQYAGNAVGGLLETFSLNDSALGDPSASWFGRLAGAAAGIRPALPNSAGEMGGEANPNMAEGGKEQPEQPPGPLSPQQAEAMKNAEKAGGEGNTVNNNINVTNNRQTEDQTGRVVQDHLNAGQAAVQPR